MTQLFRKSHDGTKVTFALDLGHHPYKEFNQCPLLRSFASAGSSTLAALQRAGPGRQRSQRPCRDNDTLLGVLTCRPICRAASLSLAAAQAALRHPGCAAANPSGVCRPNQPHLHDGGLGGGTARPSIVLAGEGVFFNCMMCQKDNDNLMFAMNCPVSLMEVAAVASCPSSSQASPAHASLLATARC